MNCVIPGFICCRCHICHEFFRIKEKRDKRNIFGQVFYLQMLPSIRGTRRILSGIFNSQSTNKCTIFPSSYLLLSLLLCSIARFKCCCSLFFSFLSFPFFACAFMIIAVIQFSAACAIRFHLFAIEIFMRCVTFAHYTVQMRFVFIQSIRFSCFWSQL